MRWRRRKSLHEELLEQGPHESRELQPPDNEAPKSSEPVPVRAVVVAIALLLASVLAHFAPLPLFLDAVAAIVFFVYFARFTRHRLPRPSRPPRFRATRLLFLVWLAISVAVLVLVAIGGFYPEDLVLLAVVGTILVVLWGIDRLLPRLWGSGAGA
jgi:hypothetical protein